MSKYLIIVESPAKAKTINKYLGKDYTVEASMGHIRDLPKTKLGVDLENNFSPKYVISTQKKKIVSRLKKAAKSMEKIFLAPDPDREGEAISYHLACILEKSTKGKIRRVTFNEITPDAVREAFKHSRDLDENLFNAQQARRILDRLVGYKLSPLLWKNVARGLSAGRVQSVALKLIIDREREIKNFTPKEYWSLEAEFSSQKSAEKDKRFKARLDSVAGEKAELATKDSVDSILKELEGAQYRVAKIDKKKRKRKPQPPFITSKLQQEAYNKLKYSAQKTMQIAQRLYEGVDLGKGESVGLITYMRTDSVNVSKTALTQVRDYIKDTYGNEYLAEKPNVYKSRKHAQQAHEAIRPTAVNRSPENVKAALNDDEFKLYELIWRRFVSSQMSDAQDLQMTVEIHASDKYIFKTTSTVNLFPGFLKVYIEEAATDEEQTEDARKEKKYELPVLTVGDMLTLLELLPEQHFTKPPARFNDASLVKLLEELGIGRPSTYAPTIQTLLFRHYVQRKASALEPSEMGELVIDLLVKHFSELLDVQFTARMEEELDEVEEGEKEWTVVLREFYEPFSKLLDEANNKMKNMKKVVILSEYHCDICGKEMAYKWGRFGKFLACTGFPDCKYTRSIPTGFLCPQPDCKGEMVRRQSKRKRVFYGCSNYPKCTFTVNRLPKEGEQIQPQNKKSKEDA